MEAHPESEWWGDYDDGYKAQPTIPLENIKLGERYFLMQGIGLETGIVTIIQGNGSDLLRAQRENNRHYQLIVQWKKPYSARPTETFTIHDIPRLRFFKILHEGELEARAARRNLKEILPLHQLTRERPSAPAMGGAGGGGAAATVGRLLGQGARTLLRARTGVETTVAAPTPKYRFPLAQLPNGALEHVSRFLLPNAKTPGAKTMNQKFNYLRNKGKYPRKNTRKSRNNMRR
jgi:hypothetical protein